MRVVVPMGIATMLDVGFSNWSLVMLSISFHVIIRGTGPLFVMLWGMLLGVERPSRRTPINIALIVAGLSLVACDRLTLPDRPLGIVLAVVSMSFMGLRWALTQLLVRGRHSLHADGRPRGAPTHPLASMLHTMPVIALASLACVLATSERRVFHELYGMGAPARELALGLGGLCVLVWVLVLAEFHLVQLTSSLTLSVFGVLKEIVTVLLAVAAGDLLSPINALGLALCILGNLLYFLKKTKEREEEDEARAVLELQGGASEESISAGDGESARCGAMARA